MWVIGVRDDTLYWHTSRWPESERSIPISSISKIELVNDSTKDELFLKDGTRVEIPFSGKRCSLYEYLKSNHPNLSVSFIDSSD
jgi:hypothetical protein